MTQSGGPYGGYGGSLQHYGKSPSDDPQAPPARIDPYVGPPLPPPAPAGPPPMGTGPRPAGPAAAYAHAPVPGRLPVQRPAVIGMAATMAVTASLQWICCLTFAWLMAAIGAQSLGTDGLEGGLYHALQRFSYGLIDGLAWPLYLFPTASFVTGFLVLVHRSWGRIVHTLVGVAALGWSAWWLYPVSLLWWIAPALYIGVACLILWLPGVGRWYRSAP